MRQIDTASNANSVINKNEWGGNAGEIPLAFELLKGASALSVVTNDYIMIPSEFQNTATRMCPKWTLMSLVLCTSVLLGEN
jgi:hypothetical protein